MKTTMNVAKVKLNYDFNNYEINREIVKKYHLDVYIGSYNLLLQIQKIIKNYKFDLSKENMEDYDELKEFEKYVMCIYLNSNEL